MFTRTRLLDAERNATLCPSALIEGATLLPFEASGKAPPGVLASEELAEQAVPAGTATQVLRMKTFSIPGVMLGPRFEASVAKAMSGPELVEQVVEDELDVAQPSARLGLSLNPFAGVVPSAVDTR